MHVQSSNGIRRSTRTDYWPPEGRSIGALLTKYLLAAGSVILVSMSVLTYLISTKVSSLVTHYVAQDTSAAITTDLSQLTQELRLSTTLSKESMTQIEALKTKDLGIHSIKIWLRDGTIAYATDKGTIGRRFQNPTLARAFAGNVVATYDDLIQEENRNERRLNTPLIEVYAPIFATGTSNIIAVGEYYKDASRLSEELQLIRIVTAASVAVVTLPMVLFLYLLTKRADRTAKQARIELKEKAEISSALALHNDELRKAAETARHDCLRSNELLLQQIGQDLHDGPMQMLSVMALKLSSLVSPRFDDAETQSALDLTQKALKELRDISSGLVLPELESLTPEQTIQLAIREHEAASGTHVARSTKDLPSAIARSVKICLFRIVQEGLNNALRHADGRGQQVTAHLDGDAIFISISDEGLGVQPKRNALPKYVPLGLAGLRRRVEILQGSLDFIRSNDGSELRARLPITLDDA